MNSRGETGEMPMPTVAAAQTYFISGAFAQILDQKLDCIRNRAGLYGARRLMGRSEGELRKKVEASPGGDWRISGKFRLRSRSGIKRTGIEGAVPHY